MASLKVGDTLPGLNTFDLEGKLPDLKGKVVLVDFWASWCAPCKKSFPVMDKLHKEYSGQGLEIVAVNVNERRDDMDKFLKKTPASFTVVHDAQQKLVKTADVTTMPFSLMIDRSGKIRFVHSGFLGAETEKKYREEIETLLKEK